MRFDAKTIALALIVGISTPAIAQQNQNAITLERTTCFGAYPVISKYWIRAYLFPHAASR